MSNANHNQRILRSTEIIAHVESRARELETSFGFEALVELVDGRFSPAERAGFVDSYRKVIRQDGSVYDPSRAPSHEDFLGAFERSSLDYLETGFAAFRWLSQPDRSITEMHRRVWVSEAMRAQDGKRSPAGLDHRLESAENEIIEALSEVPDIDPDDALDKLAVLPPHLLSAETAFVEFFLLLRGHFPTPPPRAALRTAAPEANDVLRTVLRRYLRYSIEDLGAWYPRFADIRSEDIRTFRGARERAEQERAEVEAHIRRAAPAAAPALLSSITELNELNHLNLALEPSFSFKGGPGLAHWGVIDAACALVKAPSIHLRQLALEKEERSANHKGGQR